METCRIILKSARKRDFNLKKIGSIEKRDVEIFE
jgi:hypothetical protein